MNTTKSVKYYCSSNHYRQINSFFSHLDVIFKYFDKKLNSDFQCTCSRSNFHLKIAILSHYSLHKQYKKSVKEFYTMGHSFSIMICYEKKVCSKLWTFEDFIEFSFSKKIILKIQVILNLTLYNILIIICFSYFELWLLTLHFANNVSFYLHFK